MSVTQIVDLVGVFMAMAKLENGARTLFSAPIVDDQNIFRRTIPENTTWNQIQQLWGKKFIAEPYPPSFMYSTELPIGYVAASEYFLTSATILVDNPVPLYKLIFVSHSGNHQYHVILEEGKSDAFSQLAHDGLIWKDGFKLITKEEGIELYEHPRKNGVVYAITRQDIPKERYFLLSDGDITTCEKIYNPGEKLSQLIEFNDKFYEIKKINGAYITAEDLYGNSIDISYRYINKIKWGIEKEMIHVTLQTLEASKQAELIKKEKKVKTLINVSTTLILSFLTVLSITDMVPHVVTLGAAGALLLYVILTHICECNYKTNLRIELSCSLLNFILSNILTIALGSLLAIVNVIHPFITWSDFLRYTIAVPTAVSLGTSLLPLVYMVFKHRAVIAVKKITAAVDSLFSKV